MPDLRLAGAKTDGVSSRLTALTVVTVTHYVEGVASPLHSWRTRADLTLDDVVDAADALLRSVAPRQTRYAVAERPDVRTVRYYTTRGLLPKPLSYDGGRARYGYAHLVRLLAIKRMQADHLTLEQIARALHDKSDDDVEALVQRGAHAADQVPTSRALDEVPRPRALDVPALAHERDERDVRFELAPGGHIVIDGSVLRDERARARLADNLDNVARLLRNGGSDV
jgi:DNA-binding transcriptional MerR regulator